MIELRCERCFKEAHIDWCDSTTFDDPKPTRTPGAMTCVTPGCVDETGSAATRPVPTPGELLARAERMWEDRQRELTR